MTCFAIASAVFSLKYADKLLDATFFFVIVQSVTAGYKCLNHLLRQQFLAARRSVETNASTGRGFRYGLSHRMLNSARNDNNRNSKNRLRSDSGGDSSSDTQKSQRSVLSMVRVLRAAKDGRRPSKTSKSGSVSL